MMKYDTRIHATILQNGIEIKSIIIQGIIDNICS